MSRAKLSILGLYNYDSTIFDNLVLPSSLDRDTVINNILMNLSEMRVLYTNPDTMKELIGFWSNANIHNWERMYTVMYEDYDPFINIKRDEVRTITQTRDLANNVKTNVNAYDDNSDTGVLRDSALGTDTGTVTTTENFHVEGDSAITDAQDVLKKEMEVRLKYNLINIIVNDFKKQFCLLIY